MTKLTASSPSTAAKPVQLPVPWFRDVKEVRWRADSIVLIVHARRHRYDVVKIDRQLGWVEVLGRGLTLPVARKTAGGECA